MTTREKPPRSWDMKSLMVLGEKGGTTYLKAVPVLILEKWVREGKEEGVANFVWTDQLAERLLSSGLKTSFKRKGTSNILAALTSIQNARNLKRPILIEYQGEGMFKINLPYYEQLLQEYRQKYSNDYLKEYKKLFPDEEPDWGSPILKGRLNRIEVGSEVQDEIHGLLAPVEQTLRDQQQEVAMLREKNRSLQVELVALQKALQERREVPHLFIEDDELRKDCEKRLKDPDNYIDAIRRAGVVLEERLRNIVGGDGIDMFGVALVDYALSSKNGRLIISEREAEQDGVHMLFRGVQQFMRNPPAHKKMEYSEAEAWQTINLIDYLLSLLRQAKLRGK